MKPSNRVRAAIASCILLTLALVCCGREEIALRTSSGLRGDAGGRSLCDGSIAAPACVAFGGGCSTGSDCCSNICVASVCVRSASCKAPLAACTGRDECCSGGCEPVGPDGERQCISFCKGLGTPCGAAADCCSFSCVAGVCSTARACKERNEDCSTSAECCAAECKDGRCDTDRIDESCRPTGEACDGGGGGDCCGICNVATDTCDPGPGACRAVGAPCSTGPDCCGGACIAGPDSIQRCGASCVPSGGTCASQSDCCDGGCVGSPGVCVAKSAVCLPDGNTCSTPAQCCSGQCLAGTCRTDCNLALF